MSKIKTAIVGCGAIARQMHLPILTGSDDFDVTILVDREISNAKQLAKQFSIPEVITDHKELTGKVDAAVVSTPVSAHEMIATDLADAGINVLVEKPMALSVAQCDSMIQAAKSSGSVLAVGLIRRFYKTLRFIKQVLDDGWLGEIQSFDFREGLISNWPAVSDAILRKSSGGVLADVGSHVLDLILWWFGDMSVAAYCDDAHGGNRANCEIELTLPNGGRGFVELARTRELRNTIEITGDKGILQAGIWHNSKVIITDAESRMSGQFEIPDKEQSFEDIAAEQAENFALAIRSKSKPFVSGEEGRRAIALIEECDSKRSELAEPWLSVE